MAESGEGTFRLVVASGSTVCPRLWHEGMSSVRLYYYMLLSLLFKPKKRTTICEQPWNDRK